MRHLFAFLLATLSSLCAVPAFATGFPTPSGTIPFIDFTPNGTQPGVLRQVYDSTNCSTCHAGGGAHLPYSGWAGSMMANATRDPLFWAALDVANQDGLENGLEGIGDFCLRCHAPKAWLEGRVRKTGNGTLVEGFQGCLLDGNHSEFFESDYGGLSCHFCHRMMDQSPLGEPSMIGNSDGFIDDSNCNGQGEPCRRGPYNYPVDVPFDGAGLGTYNGPPHAWKYSPYHKDSALCGSCHDVTSPPGKAGAPVRTLILANGQGGHDTGLAYPIERTYSEWLASDYSTVVFSDGLEQQGDIVGLKVTQTSTCQNCHMPQAEAPPGNPDMSLYACTSGGPPRNGNLATHEFAGGNVWIPTILKGEYVDLLREQSFDLTIAAATRMLGDQSAKVQVTTAQVSGGQANVAVKVTNLAGHKLPTGYGEGRRMWLNLQVRDANGMLVYESGAFDPATGDLTIDSQTKIYEIKQGIWDASANGGAGACKTEDGNGKEMFHFVLNNCIAKDNRIPPLGFTGAGNPETASYGYSYPAEPGAPGRSVNYDVTSYSFPVAGASYPLTVQATLQYQTASKDYIEFLKNQAVEKKFPAENDLCADAPNRPFFTGPQNKSRGQYLFDLWNNPAYGRSPPVSAGSASVQITGP